MTVSLAASLIELALGSELGASGDAGRNRCTLEGVTWQSMPDGGIELRVRRFEAMALRLASDPFVLEIDRIDVHELVARLRTEAGVPRLVSVQADKAECSGLKLHGPLVLPPQIQKIREASQGVDASAATPTVAGQAAADAWRLAPLNEAEGTIRGQITDAHLLFDADVTVPIRHGQIDFNDATVEHVGPDSRMGVSRMGIYVDAPNGRSYLYQFAAAPLAGVVFEHRGILLGPWVSERGKLQLQTFAESMLRQGRRGPGQGLTQQARLLLGRTSLSGELRLGEGLVAVPGLQVHLEGPMRSGCIPSPSAAASRWRWLHSRPAMPWRPGRVRRWASIGRRRSWRSRSWSKVRRCASRCTSRTASPRGCGSIFRAEGRTAAKGPEASAPR
ncbi:hypothetical protein LJR161_005350 [Variovorax paradoxus]|uniref:hypothetical protein n=1 Tax=Variovorax paradoxus TaxID=34073 RepID=UPI003ED0CFF2